MTQKTVKCLGGNIVTGAKEMKNFAQVSGNLLNTREKLRLVKEMSDQGLLAQTAMKTNSPKVGYEAVGKLDDIKLIFTVAMTAKNECVAARAARNILDPLMLKKLTLSKQQNVREMAAASLEKLKTPEGIIELIGKDAKIAGYVFDKADGALKDGVLAMLSFGTKDTKPDGSALEALYEHSKTAKGVFTAMNMTDCGANSMNGAREHFPC